MTTPTTATLAALLALTAFLAVSELDYQDARLVQRYQQASVIGQAQP